MLSCSTSWLLRGFMEPARITGKAFAIIVCATAAAEAALGLALTVAIWRTENTVTIEEIDLLRDSLGTRAARS